MFEKLDFDTIIISTLMAIAITVGVSWFFRFRTKPKFEIIYDSNREENLTYVFNGLEMLDSDFGSFCEIFEDNFGLLTKEKKEIVPRPSSSSDGNITYPQGFAETLNRLRQVKENLTPMLTRMRDNHNKFLRDYHIYHNYIHDSFLRNVSLYYWTTTYYIEWLLKGHHVVNSGEKRQTYAKKIIEYIERDTTYHKNIPSISHFVNKWKNY